MKCSGVNQPDRHIDAVRRLERQQMKARQLVFGEVWRVLEVDNSNGSSIMARQLIMILSLFDKQDRIPQEGRWLSFASLSAAAAAQLGL